MTMLITATALARLLRPVLPFASEDLTRPVLSCVLIETRGTYDFKAVVSADTLAALLRIFKPAHDEVPVTLELAVDRDVLTVSQVNYTTPDGFTGATFQARVSTLPFPKVDSMVLSMLDAEGSAAPAKFDWRHMVEFAYVDAPDGLFITTHTPPLASVVTNGTDFVGLITPRRAVRYDHTLDDGWDAILSPAKTEKAGVA